MSEDEFHAELEELKKDTYALGMLAVGMLEEAVQALQDRDRDRAESVIERKAEVARSDNRIEEQALRLLTLYQPMAGDLRTLGTVLKVITYLTRIGRYGKDIANLVIELGEQPHVAKLVGMPGMARRVSGMIRDVLDAFADNSVEALDNIAARDDEIDALRWSIFREVLTYMMEGPRNIPRCASYMMIARYLERCGDHACKIAEKVHYMVVGTRIEIK